MLALLFPLVLVLILVIVAALLGSSGLWGNLITLVNTVVAGLLATNYFEAFAGWIVNTVGLSYYADLAAFWLLFGVIFTVLRVATDLTSKFKVRFPKPVEMAGAYVLALAVGWVLVCLVTMSIHLAPLGRTVLFDGFKPEEPCFYGIAPDRLWLGFAQRASQGAFGGTKVFDADGSFLIRYAARREKFDRNEP